MTTKKLKTDDGVVKFNTYIILFSECKFCELKLKFATLL